jgi:hypothetical protein
MRTSPPLRNALKPWRRRRSATASCDETSKPPATRLIWCCSDSHGPVACRHSHHLSGSAHDESATVLAAVSFAVTTAADSATVCCRGIHFDKTLCTTTASRGVSVVRTTTTSTELSKYLDRPSHPKYHRVDRGTPLP